MSKGTISINEKTGETELAEESELEKTIILKKSPLNSFENESPAENETIIFPSGKTEEFDQTIVFNPGKIGDSSAADETIIVPLEKVRNMLKGTESFDETQLISRSRSTHTKKTKKIYILLEGLIEKEYILDRNKTLIGRHPSNDIVLNDSKISRYHAEIVFEDGVYKVINKSSNKILFKNKEVYELTLENKSNFEITPFTLQYVEL